MGVKIKAFLPIFLASLMILSGLSVLDTVPSHNNSGTGVQPSASTAQNYTLTFRENGLENLFPGSMNWTVLIWNSTGASINKFTGPQGTVNLSAGSIVYYEAYDYLQSPFYSSNFTVNSNMTFYLNFTVPHKFTFVGTGLGSNYVWGVNMTPMSSSSKVYTPNATVNGGSSIVYYGTFTAYDYSWYEIHKGTTEKIGSSSFNMASADTNLTFRLPLNSLSNVTLKESNLPAGTEWFVTPSNHGMSTDKTNGSTINLTLQNGLHTYTYGYVLHNGQKMNMGNITVNAGVVSSYNIQFPAMTNVTFGLATPFPAYTTGWGIMGNFSYNGFANSFNVSGSYARTNSQTYLLLPSSNQATFIPYIIYGFIKTYTGTGGYLVSWPSYTIDVGSSTASQTVPFSNYQNVSVSVPGIPSGTSATVSSTAGGLPGYSETISSGQSFNFLATNGTYSFILDLRKNSEFIPFNVTVGGSNPTSSVPLYKVSMSPPAQGTLGAEILGHGSALIYNYGALTAGASLTAYLPNGTYAYYEYVQNAGPSDITIYENGNLSITGSAQTLANNFPAHFYNVTVNAVGLGVKSQWRADVTSVQEYYIYTYTNLTTASSSWIWLPTGEYQMGLNSANNTTQDFFSNATVTNVTSTGANSFNLEAISNSHITFSESGLLPGTVWSVTFDGKTYSSKGTSITTSVNLGFETGSYSFAVGKINGFSSNPGSGVVNLSVANDLASVVVPIVFTPNGLMGNLPGMSTYNLVDHKLQAGAYLGTNNSRSGGPFAIDGARGNLYAAYSNSGNAGILVLNSSTYAMKKDIHLQSTGNVFSMVVDQASGYLYAAYKYYYAYYILSVNLNTFSATLTPTPNFNPVTIMPDPVNGNLYVGGTQNIYMLNPHSLAVESVIHTPGSIPYSFTYPVQPIGLEYSNATGMIYATGYSYNSVIEINPSTNTVVGSYTFSLPKGQQTIIGGSVLDSANGNLYLEVTHYRFPDTFSSQFEVFSPTTGKFLNTVPLPAGSDYMLLVNPTNGNIYAPMDRALNENHNYSSLGIGTLAEVSIAQNRVVDTFQTGASTYQAIFDNANGNVLVSSEASGSINIISATPAYGYLRGTVSNSAANVSVDGIPVQLVNGAFNITLSPGTYYLSAYARGSTPVAKQVTVSGYSTTKVNVQMAPSTTYKVYGYVSPGSASVNLNGVSATVNSAGFFSTYVTGGSYTLSAFLNGYFPYSGKIDVKGNMEVNISMLSEPVPTSVLHNSSLTSQGFHASLSNLTETSSNISVDFTSSGNGTVTISVPLSDLKQLNLSDILGSSVYVNGTQYHNFTISVSSNFTVTLTVRGLSGDPLLVWSFTPAAATPPAKIPSGNGQIMLYAGVSAVIILAGGFGYYFFVRKKKQ